MTRRLQNPRKSRLAFYNLTAWMNFQSEKITKFDTKNSENFMEVVSSLTTGMLTLHTPQSRSSE